MFVCSMLNGTRSPRHLLQRMLLISAFLFIYLFCIKVEFARFSNMD